MELLSYNRLREQAGQRLQGYGRAAVHLVLIHAGISLGVSIVSTLINYLLDMGIAQTGGLGGMDARATLEAVQTLLTTVQSLAMPFWQMGYVFVVLSMAREKSVQNRDLLTGFRCFGVVLRGKFLSGMIYFVLMLVGAQAGMLLFMLTPAAKDLLNFQIDASMSMDALLRDSAYLQVMLPSLPFLLGGMLLPLIPVYYRLRMMDYVLMDEPKAGALYALLRSMQLTKKQTWSLMKLDLRFWWFYLLQLLVAALCYGDYLLPMVGVDLPFSREGAMYLFYALALLAELGLYAWKKNQVFVTYALAYDCLRDHVLEQADPVRQQPETSVPWQY